MDNRPGRGTNHSKLTDKYIAGRGRVLKDLARRSPKAEEVEKRKQIQQLILSGKILLDKEIIDRYFNADKSGSRSNSESSSSSQLQLVEDSEEDSCVDLTSEKTCSKAPVGFLQLQDGLQVEAVNNNLEKNMQKLNIVDENQNSCDDRIPPRFRNKQQEKNFKKRKNKPWVNQQKQSGNDNAQSKVEAGWGKSLSDKTVPQDIQSPWSGAHNQPARSDAWHDWEASVVVHGPINDEDLEELVVVDDNDNLDDVMVQQYVNALHQEQTNGAALVEPASSKVTPSRIQELGNLKSTINADSYKVPAGTIPNPPKGPDRWGGSELKDISEPTGWGDIVEDSGNWYDDGAVLWGAPSMPYGASGGWSWNS